MSTKQANTLLLLFVKLFLLLFLILFIVPQIIDNYINIFLDNMQPKGNSIFVYNNILNEYPYYVKVCFLIKKLILFM